MTFRSPLVLACFGCALACSSSSVDAASPAVTLASVPSVARIAIDADNVYWTEPSDGKVMKVSIEGGTPVELASAQDAPFAIAVREGSVFWINSGSTTSASALLVVSASGGAPRVLESDSLDSKLAVDSTHVYWATTAPSQAMMKTPVGGGSAVTLAPIQVLLGGIAVDATNVYWTEYAGIDAPRNNVFEVPAAGGASVLLTASPTLLAPLSIVVSNGSVYWISIQIPHRGIDGGTITKLTVSDGTGTSLGGSDAPIELAVDANAVYWTDDRGTIFRVPVGGGTQEALVTGEDHPSSIAVGGGRLFWATSTAIRSMKLDR